MRDHFAYIRNSHREESIVHYLSLRLVIDDERINAIKCVHWCVTPAAIVHVFF